MTTVVYHRDHGLFADGRTTDGSAKLPDARKIHDMGAGVFAATLGNVSTGFKMLSLLKAHLNGGCMVGEDEPIEKLMAWVAPLQEKCEALFKGVDEDAADHATLVVVDMNSRDWMLQLTSRIGCGVFFELSRKDKFLAFGSGCNLAMGALQVGASPIAAIIAASKHDLSTGPTGHFVAPWSLDHANPIKRFR